MEVKTKYRLGLVYDDGHKCWAQHSPLNTMERAKAAMTIAWLGIGVKEVVLIEADTNEIIERYDG